MATPSARALLNAYQGNSPDDLDQLLGTHKLGVIYDNATAVVTPGGMLFAGNMPLYAPRGRDAALVSTLMTYNDTIIADGPLGFWRLNETTGTVAVDQMGLNNGTYYQPIQNTYYGTIPGVKDPTAIYLPVAAAYSGPAPYNQKITITGFNPVVYTWEIWAHIPTGTPGFDEVIMGNNTHAYGGEAGGYIGIRSGSNPGRTGCYADSVAGGYQATDESSPDAAGWHYLVATCDTTHHLTFYVDGVLKQIGTDTPGTPTASNGQAIVIGFNGIGPLNDRPFIGGGVAQAAVYGYALSAAQILAHYNAAANNVNVIEETTGTLDQPITLSGNIDRITLPLSTYKGVGTDILVSLYADSSGAPTGVPLASTLVPKESLVIPTPMTQSAPDPIAFNGPCMMGAFQQIQSPNSSASVGLGIGPLNFVAMVSAYNYIIAMGGQDQVTNAITNSVSMAAVLDTDAGPELGPWVAQVTMPLALSQCAATVYTGDSGSYIVLVGGTPDGTATVVNTWTASIAQDGTLGTWIAQPDLISGVRDATVLVSNGFVYVIGGQRTDTSHWVMYAAISGAGTIGAWTTSPLFDYTYGRGHAGGAINGYLLIGNGIQDSPSTVATSQWWIAHPAANGSIPGWIPLPNSPVAVGDGAFAVMGDTLICTSGNYGTTTFSISVSPTGDISPWKVQAPLSQMVGSRAVTTGSELWVVGPQLGYQTAVTRTPFISVPLQATSLASAPYHFVLSLAGEADVDNDSQITTSNISPGASYNQALGKLDTGGFTTTAGNIIPTLMSGASITQGWSSGLQRGAFGPYTAAQGWGVQYTGGNLVLHDISYYDAIANTAISTDPITNLDNVAITGPLAIPVIPGQNYTFSAAFLAATTGRATQIGVYWADVNGVVQNTAVQGYGPAGAADAYASGTDTTGTATLLSLQATAPLWARFVKLEVCVVTTGLGTSDEQHTVSNINMYPTYGFVPISVYTSGLTARPIHIVEDTIAGQPQRHGWLAYKYNGQPLRYIESTVEKINLLPRNTANFGTSVKGDTSGWPTLGNCSISVIPLSGLLTPPLGPQGPQNQGGALFPSYNVQEMQWAIQASSTAAGDISVRTGMISGITAGMSYTAFGFMMAATVGRSIVCAMAFFDQFGNQLVSNGWDNGASVSDTTTGWVQPFVTAVAPAGAVSAMFEFYLTGTASAAELHYISSASLAVTSHFPLSFFTPGQGGVGNVRTLNYAADGSLASIV